VPNSVTILTKGLNRITMLPQQMNITLFLIRERDI
jgi:hypothetical protein